MDIKEEVRNGVKALGIKNLEIFEAPEDSNCPPDLKWEIQVGEYPFSWHFYGATENSVWEDVSRWLDKTKTKKCLCDW
jgi:hypothetical protein